MKRVTPLALLLAAAGALEAQQVPTVTLPRASATFSEPFTQIVGLRELPDGRVILADPRERTLALLDFRSGQATRIGREGQGPGEWRLPNGVYALPGDSTLVFDVGNMRYLVVDPKGQPAYTFSLIGDGAPGGGQRAVAPGGSGRRRLEVSARRRRVASVRSAVREVRVGREWRVGRWRRCCVPRQAWMHRDDCTSLHRRFAWDRTARWPWTASR